MPKAELVLIIIAWVGFGLSLLMAFEQLIVKQRRVPNLTATLINLCNGINIHASIQLFLGNQFESPRVLFLLFPALFAVGPLLLLYNTSIYSRQSRYRGSFMLTFIPAVTALAGDVVFQLLPLETRREVIQAAFALEPVNVLVIAAVLAAVYALPFLGYLLFIQLSILRGGEAEHREELTVTAAVIATGILGAIFLFTGFISGLRHLFLANAVLLSLNQMTMFFEHTRSPFYFQLVQKEIARHRYRISTLRGIDTESILRRLDYLFKEEKIYRDYELTLQKLAESLHVTPHQLSELMNEKLKVNFNNYVNKYRVEEARDLLINEPESTIISICFHVGFNSKSSFNSAFKKFTGLKPSDLRRPGRA